MTTETMKTVSDRIQEYGLTMTAEPVPENPNMDDMSKGSQHYCVTITNPHGTSLTTHYSVGPRIVDLWLHEKLPANHVWRKAPRSMDGHAYRNQAQATPGHAYYSFRTETKPTDYRPELADVLDCLASDASAVENSRYFEDWAAELGYEADSRKAERTFRICEQAARDLRYLIGSREAFEGLLFETERM